MAENSLHVLLTGATGYQGGTFLTLLLREYPTWTIAVLVRTEEHASAIRSFYAPSDASRISPVIGTLDSAATLIAEASKADIVVQCADLLHEAGIMALIEGVSRSTCSSTTNKLLPFLMDISGSSNVGRPEPYELGTNDPRVWSDVTDYDEIRSLPPQYAHADLDREIISTSAVKGVRTVMLSPGMILGKGMGPVKTESYPHEWYKAMLKLGASFYVGKGESKWSATSVRDVARAMLFAIAQVLKGPRGCALEFNEQGLYFVQAFDGPSAKERAEAAAERLSTEGKIRDSVVRALTAREAEELWSFVEYIAGTSSRSNADRLKALGWKPEDMNWRDLMEEGGGERV